MVPTFTMYRSTREMPSFVPAASPRLRRRPSPWPPHRRNSPASELTAHPSQRSRTAPRPRSTRLEPVRRLRNVNTGFSRTPSRLACRTRTVWQYRHVPSLSGPLPALPGASQVRLPSASTQLLRQPGGGVLSSPLGHTAPRGAPSRPRTSDHPGRAGRARPHQPAARRIAAPTGTSSHESRHVHTP
jgi:hypothetical protein